MEPAAAMKPWGASRFGPHDLMLPENSFGNGSNLLASIDECSNPVIYHFGFQENHRGYSRRELNF